MRAALKKDHVTFTAFLRLVFTETSTCSEVILREDQVGQYSIEELGQFWTLTKSKQASHFHYEIAEYKRQIEQLNAKQAAQSLDKVAKM